MTTTTEYYNPDVTVVIPAYNAAHTIGDCLESLLAQDYPIHHYNIIVVDNNSTDDTVTIVRAYRTELTHEPIQTPAAARNRGIALSKTEIVAFLDSDCVPEESWLRSLIKPFKDSHVSVVGGKIASHIRESEIGLIESYLAQLQLCPEASYHPDKPKGFPTSNVAYRIAAVKHVGAFDASLPAGEDIDLAWRVQATTGVNGVYVPEAVVYHKPHRTLWAHHRQFKRYGRNEIILTTLFRGQPVQQHTPKYQLWVMGLQIMALFTYLVSFCVRLLRWRRWQDDHLYLATPLLRSVTELSNLIGKIEGLIMTRFFHQNPYPTSDSKILKSRMVAFQ